MQGKNRGFQVRGSGLVGEQGAEPQGHRWIFENLRKNPEENCKNAVFSPILQKNFKNMRKILARLGEKNCLGKICYNFENVDANSMGKLNFYLFLGKFVAKKNLEIKSFFYNYFYRFRGVWTPLTPLHSPLDGKYTELARPSFPNKNLKGFTEFLLEF